MDFSIHGVGWGWVGVWNGTPWIMRSHLYSWLIFFQAGKTPKGDMCHAASKGKPDQASTETDYTQLSLVRCWFVFVMVHDMTNDKCVFSCLAVQVLLDSKSGQFQLFNAKTKMLHLRRIFICCYSLYLIRKGQAKDPGKSFLWFLKKM